MTESATVFAPQPGHALEIALLVAPRASLLTLGSLIDPLRAANRHLGREAFRWRICTEDAGPARLTCGIALPADAALRDLSPPPEALFVLAGYGARDLATPALRHDLRQAARGARMLAAVDSGSWLLAAAGLMRGARVTTHWEDLEDFAAAYPDIEVAHDRYVIDGRRVSIGGAGPAQDLMLRLIGARHGTALAMQVAGTFITSRRSGAESQLSAIAAGRPTGGDPRVSAAVARIESRMDAPEPAAATARAVGLSPRRLETLFRAELGLGPGRYGQELRLQSARRMVADTRHPLSEIALRCGFGSQSALSRAFRIRFGAPPSTLRARLAD